MAVVSSISIDMQASTQGYAASQPQFSSLSQTSSDMAASAIPSEPEPSTYAELDADLDAESSLA